jgi:diguanylate cyclase (GGDEF)-like protein/PAS domain S-box-containing protein
LAESAGRKAWEISDWVQAWLDAAEFVVLATDEAGMVRYCSGGIRKFFGYEPAERVGRSPLDLINPDDLARRAEELSRELGRRIEPGFEALVAKAAPGQGDERDWALLRKDRTTFPGRLTIRPTHDNAETGFVLVARAAKEGRRVEQALHESEERFKGAFQHSPVGMALVSPEGRYLQVNPALCRMLGYTEAELLNRTFVEISHPDDLGLSLSSDRDLLADKVESYQIQKRYLRKDGQVVWAMVNASLVRGPDRQPLHFVGQILDVTAQRQAEEARRETEERFRDLFENASDLIQCAGPDGHLQYVNRAWRQKLGYSEEEVPTLTLQHVIDPESLPDLQQAYNLALAGEEVGTTVAKFVAKSGQIIVVEGDISCSFHDGKPSQTRGIFRDVTERRRLEDMLDEYRKDLEATNARLEQANLRLKDMATIDPLTGLFNRLVLQKRLKEEFQRAKRYGTPLSLILLDVDRFKSFNDTFGHPAGDEVLQMVGKLLRFGARNTDVIARFGGEEFAVLCPSTDANGAAVLAERFRKSFEDASWTWRPVTASFGLTQYNSDMLDPAALISTADQALYRAKENGRNRVER